MEITAPASECFLRIKWNNTCSSVWLRVSESPLPTMEPTNAPMGCPHSELLLSTKTEQTIARETVRVCLFLKGNLLRSFFFSELEFSWYTILCFRYIAKWLGFICIYLDIRVFRSLPVIGCYRYRMGFSVLYSKSFLKSVIQIVMRVC